MIIGFGFGSPFIAVVMLILTSLLSYFFFKVLRSYRSKAFKEREMDDEEEFKERRREYYYQQREKVREMIEEFNLTDEEIERKIAEELNIK